MEGQLMTDTRRCRILVVDDHPASAEMLVEILTMEGYAIEVARSGREALDIARSFAPALALLDIGLPDMNGFALARLFKAEAGLQQIRLIAVSGYGQAHDPSSSQQSCFDRYLVKPVDVEELLSLLADLSQADPDIP
jgi:CheY-like chemotaxis protein